MTAPEGSTEVVAFAPPRVDISIEDCFFYHTMDIPGVGVVHGQWDLRPSVQTYLGEVCFSGKRVFEVGPASGFLTFHMEQLGGQVIACELPRGEEWDLVRYDGVDLRPYIESRNEVHQKLINGFWFAHRAFQSKAGVLYKSVYDIPPGLGQFDIATFHAVLLHVQNPYLALQQILSRTRESVIITELVPWDQMPQAIQEGFSALPGCDSPPPCGQAVSTEIAARILDQPPAMFFCPRAAAGAPKETWWHFTPAVLREFIAIAGFVTESIVFHYQVHDSRYQWAAAKPGEAKKTSYPCFTLVGRRTSPGRGTA